jgi:glucose-1-phosphatase
MGPHCFSGVQKYIFASNIQKLMRIMERKIRNIIFDLGGVILNIDYKLTEIAFVKLGLENFEDLYAKQKQLNLFDKFETGEITADRFRESIRNISGSDPSDEQINEAWNKMLIDLPEKNLSFLLLLKKKYRLFLLSNTNEIHINGFMEIINRDYGYLPFDDIFEKTYYSNRVRLRKPDEKIFRLVLEENNLSASETLFIDDTERHLAGATAAGLHTLHLNTGSDLSNALKNLL